MDSFQGADYINLQPGDSNVPYRFNITVASSSKRNDGHLPYGSTLCSSTARAHCAGGSTVGTSNIVGAVSVSSEDVLCRLNYSTDAGLGEFHIKIIVTASVQGSTVIPLVKQLDFNRVYMKDR